MDKVFYDFKFNCVNHYVNVIVLYSETYGEHFEHVRESLERLRPAGLTVKPEKFIFATQEISSIVHLVSPRSAY
jgi:hypothetical protein